MPGPVMLNRQDYISKLSESLHVTSNDKCLMSRMGTDTIPLCPAARECPALTPKEIPGQPWALILYYHTSTDFVKLYSAEW